jgi:hypothetical protein
MKTSRLETLTAPGNSREVLWLDWSRVPYIQSIIALHPQDHSTLELQVGFPGS